MKNRAAFLPATLIILLILLQSSCGNPTPRPDENADGNDVSDFPNRITDEEFERLSKLAENGDVDAQFYMGLYHFTGMPATPEFMKSIVPSFQTIHLIVKYSETEKDFFAERFGGVEKWNLASAEAAKWFSLAADQGHLESKYYLGVLFHNGLGVAYDPSRAVELLTPVANAGNAEAQYRLATLYFGGEGTQQDIETGFRWLRLSANNNFASAQRLLGLAYAEGGGIPQDYQEARTWLIRSIDNETADFSPDDTPYFVGIFYLEGLGVTQNFTEAAKFFEQSAERGFPPAQFDLGTLYLEGKGVPQNEQEGLKWMKLAADQGEPDAIDILLKMGHLGAPEVTEDEEGSGSVRFHFIDDEWLEKFQIQAESGDPLAQVYMGLHYMADQALLAPASLKSFIEIKIKLRSLDLARDFLTDGQAPEEDNTDKISPENVAAAVVWLEKAANAGNLEAMYYLGSFYYIGLGVERNPARAVQYWLPVAEHGYYPDIYTKIAFYYSNLSQDFSDQAKANEWFIKAANENDCYLSRLSLAERYADGIGTKVDMAESAKWYQINADDGCQISQYVLGIYYLQENGVPFDPVKAFDLFSKAAAKNYSSAYSMMGFCYLLGLGVEKDTNLAVQNMEKGAGLGCEKSFTLLASAYSEDRYGLKNPVEAYAWLNVGAGRGDQELQTERGELGKTMTREQLQQAQDRSLAINRRLREIKESADRE